MSIFRILGIEFTSFRTDTKHPVAKDATGYEIGNKIGYCGHDLIWEALSNYCGVDKKSESWFDFEDNIKFGRDAETDFIRDVLAGFEQAAMNMKAMKAAVGNFSYAAKYISRTKPMFPFEADLSNLVKADFYFVNPTNPSEPRSALELFSSVDNTFTVVNGRLQMQDGYDLLIESKGIDESKCRAATRFYNQISSNLYIVIQDIMRQEKEKVVASQIKHYIEHHSKNEVGVSLPNFYLM